jgi:hypothetical protein
MRHRHKPPRKCFAGTVFLTRGFVYLFRKGSTFAMWATRPTTSITMISFILLIVVAALSEGKLIKLVLKFFG